MLTWKYILIDMEAFTYSALTPELCFYFICFHHFLINFSWSTYIFRLSSIHFAKSNIGRHIKTFVLTFDAVAVTILGWHLVQGCFFMSQVCIFQRLICLTLRETPKWRWTQASSNSHFLLEDIKGIHFKKLSVGTRCGFRGFRKQEWGKGGFLVWVMFSNMLWEKFW